ncbi:MAG: transcriptional repressor, partial [Acidimicrobiales bacterium]
MPAPDGRPSRTSRRLCVTSTEDSIHRHVRARLASLDRRYTPGRRRLVDLLVEARRPVSLPELLAMDANIPQSSIYRNLEVLERSGLVHRLAVAGEHARFELAEPLLRHHHHLLCTACGAV